MVSAEGGVDIEEVAEKTPEQIHKECIEPGDRAGAVPGAQARVRARPDGRSGRQGHEDDARPPRRLCGHRRVAARDQPAHRHQGRRPAGARRQDELRRQRAVPPRRYPRSARSGRRGSARGRGVEVLAELHSPRRQHRLHGQRRRAGDGHDGHHQAGGRRAGELPRRRRRRQRRADSQRVQDPDVRQEREGRAHQHLRRHSALRRARRRA